MADLTGTRFKIIEMQPCHMEKYVRVIGEQLTYPDFITPQEYEELSRTHEYFKSWLLVEKNEPEKWVGWFASGYPSPYLSTAVEHYGIVILPPYRGQGLAKLIFDWRFSLFPGMDIIGTAKPTNIISMNHLISRGLRPYKYDDPWIVFLRRANSNG